MIRMYWHNFVTGEYDYREAPITDEEASSTSHNCQLHLVSMKYVVYKIAR